MEKMASLGNWPLPWPTSQQPISGVLTYARLVAGELGEQPLEPAIRDELTRYLSLVERVQLLRRNQQNLPQPRRTERKCRST
jgi:hypothetical protein